MDEKIIELKTTKIYWEDEGDGILCSQSKSVDMINLDDAYKTIEVYKNHFPHSNRKLLADITQRKYIGKEVRDYMNGPDGLFNYFDAIAIVDDSKYNLTSMIIYTLLKIIKPQKPTKLFFNKRDAINWLMNI